MDLVGLVTSENFSYRAEARKWCKSYTDAQNELKKLTGLNDELKDKLDETDDKLKKITHQLKVSEETVTQIQNQMIVQKQLAETKSYSHKSTEMVSILFPSQQKYAYKHFHIYVQTMQGRDITESDTGTH